MSLLSQASLVLTPNAIAEDKLYSIIPSNGNGDMAVTRATTATRVNSEGFIEEVPYNLVKYSEMFADASWGKQNSTVIANITSAPNGTLTADRLSATGTNTSHNFNQSLNFTQSTNYTFSVYVKIDTNNFVQLTMPSPAFGVNAWANFDLLNGVLGTVASNASASIINTGGGWFKCSITSTATTTSTTTVFVAIISSSTSARLEINSLSTSLYIWGAQLTQGSTIKDYFLTTDRLNVPRLNYDVAGGCPSILLEPQRTNLNTNYLGQDWSGTLNKTNNFGISPEGIQNSTQLINNVGNNQDIRKIYSVTSGLTYTFSFYVKKTSGTFSVGQARAYIFSSPSGNVDFSDVSTEWKRYSLTFTATATGTQTFQIRTDAISTIEIYGLQIEVGAYPTSIIPTVASTVTRNADVLSRNNIYTNGLINSDANAWFLDQSSNQWLGVNGICYVLFNGAQFSNSLLIQANSNGTLLFRKFTNSASTITQVITNSNVLRTKLIIRWNNLTGVLNIFLNGVLVHSFTSQIFDNYQTLILYDANSGQTPVTHSVNSLMLFPTPLTDSECIQLTTL